MNRVIYKSIKRLALIFCLATIQIFFTSGCSSREEKPVVLNDSTIVYPSKYKNEFQPRITLSNKISKKTGKPIKPATVFKLQEQAKLYASVELENQESMNKRDLMFHIDWIDSAGNSFYKKRIDFSPDDSSSSLTGSISISPKKRKVGSYTVCVYLFRELIAEKKFQLVKSITDSVTVKKKNKSKSNVESVKTVNKKKILKPKIKPESIKASIILCRKVSKKTGNPIGAATIFTLKDSAKVKAVVSIEKKNIKTNEQMKFYFDWIGPDGKSFYKKRVVYTTSNPFFTISNSISISPEKRKTGNYILRVSFRKKIIVEQKFELVAQTKSENSELRN
jgi:hypothetical protein